MPIVEIRVRGQARVARQLDLLSGNDLMLRYHERVATRIMSWVRANFEAGGLERPWAPLRPNTIYARRQSGKGGGVQPLRSGGPGGSLFQSLNKRATAYEAVVGFGSPVAKFHQFGTRGPYPIAPRFKQALSFPSLWTSETARATLGPRRFARLFRGPGGTPRRPAFAMRHSPALVRRLWLSPAQGSRPGAFERMTTFQQQSRGRADFARLTFMTVRHVTHPGLPARRLLPSAALATEIAREVAQNMIRELLTGTVGGGL